MFPQPNSNQAATGNQNFFRLFTQILSPGDLYASEQSCHAIAIGPNSDLNNVTVYYVDPLTTFFLNGAGVPQEDTSKVGSLTVSPDRPYIGRIDALNTSAVYPLSGRPGRILFAAADIVDPAWTPTGFVVDADAITYLPIYLDVIQYFTPVESLTPQRSDRTYQLQWFDEGVDPLTDSSWLVVPAYGRKSGFFSFINRGVASPHTIRVVGVVLSTSAPPGTAAATEKELFATTLNVGDGDTFQFDSSRDGLYDIFAIEIQNYDQATPIPMTIRLSDDAL